MESPDSSPRIPIPNAHLVFTRDAARHAVSAGHSADELVDTRSTHGSGAAVASEPVTKPMLGAHTNIIMQNVQIGHSTAMNGLRRPQRDLNVSDARPRMAPDARSMHLTHTMIHMKQLNKIN